MDRYQEWDAACIDYQLWEWRRSPDLPDGVLHLRGPAPEDGPHLSCLGSAHTFGRHCHTPYPQLLGRALGLEVYNFSRGGFGPRTWLDNSPVLEVVNRSRCVVLQMPSARGQTNSLYPTGKRYSQRVETADGQTVAPKEMLREILRRYPRRRQNQILSEMREGYVREMVSLLGSIHVPKILLYFSKRRASYWTHRFSPKGVLGKFPGLVDQSMIDAIRSHADGFISCISTAGVPQALTSRTGGLRGVNCYYPTPEMHVEAARLLAPICRSVMVK